MKPDVVPTLELDGLEFDASSSSSASVVVKVEVTMVNSPAVAAVAAVAALSQDSEVIDCTGDSDVDSSHRVMKADPGAMMPGSFGFVI